MATPVKAEVVKVTPKMAGEWLATVNEGNRNLRPFRVHQYARDMRAGKWKVNGDAVSFNGDGGLLNGQHRLAAIIEADTAVELLIATGVSQEAHATIDTGTPRQMADELRWRGEHDVTRLAAALRYLWNYDDDSVLSMHRILASRSELVALLDRSPEIRADVRLASIGWDRGKIRPTTLAAVLHIVRREHGEQVVEDFMKWLTEGTGYKKGDPCLALRNYAINVYNSRSVRPSGVEWMAVQIKAFNAWISGRTIDNLRWRRIGPQPEDFPTVITRKEL